MRRPTGLVLVSGYEPDVVADVVSSRLSAAALNGMGAQGEPIIGGYRLAFAMTPQDVAAK